MRQWLRQRIESMGGATELAAKAGLDEATLRRIAYEPSKKFVHISIADLLLQRDGLGLWALYDPDTLEPLESGLT
jgi:hypothetical protein